MKKPNKSTKKQKRVADMVNHKTSGSGYFGIFGGRYVPEILINALDVIFAGLYVLVMLLKEDPLEHPNVQEQNLLQLELIIISVFIVVYVHLFVHSML